MSLSYTVRTVETISELYEYYRRPILAHLMRLVRHRETAEDLCQETFVKVVHSLGQLHTAEHTAAWLYRIATNTAYDYLRRDRKRSYTPLENAEGLCLMLVGNESQLEAREPLLNALAQLPAHYRAPLMLYAAGYRLREIATKLDCSEGTIKTRLMRARKRFRRVYQD